MRGTSSTLDPDLTPWEDFYFRDSSAGMMGWNLLHNARYPLCDRCLLFHGVSQDGDLSRLYHLPLFIHGSQKKQTVRHTPAGCTLALISLRAGGGTKMSRWDEKMNWEAGREITGQREQAGQVSNSSGAIAPTHLSPGGC